MTSGETSKINTILLPLLLPLIYIILSINKLFSGISLKGEEIFINILLVSINTYNNSRELTIELWIYWI